MTRLDREVQRFVDDTLGKEARSPNWQWWLTGVGCGIILLLMVVW
jgi:hypothetical protein